MRKTLLFCLHWHRFFFFPLKFCTECLHRGSYGVGDAHMYSQEWCGRNCQIKMISLKLMTVQKEVGDMLAQERFMYLHFSGETEHFMIVLVHSGCYNKNLTDWVAYKQHIYFSRYQRLEVRSYRQVWCLVQFHSLVHRHCLLTVTSHGRRGQGALSNLFYKEC